MFDLASAQPVTGSSAPEPDAGYGATRKLDNMVAGNDSMVAMPGIGRSDAMSVGERVAYKQAMDEIPEAPVQSTAQPYVAPAVQQKTVDPAAEQNYIQQRTEFNNNARLAAAQPKPRRTVFSD